MERRGRIQILDNGAILPQPFLDIRSEVSTSGERGLLGLAFAQDYPVSGEFYVYYVNRDGNSVVSRFAVSADPNLADPTETVILVVDQPFSNHNGGTIAFDADGFLLFGLGDGGDSNDPAERAQDPAELPRQDAPDRRRLPARTRLDPRSRRELRHPRGQPVGGGGRRRARRDLGVRTAQSLPVQRRSADGDLWIADVGQNQQEEIDFEPAGDPGGRNWGWDVMEGTLCNLNDPAPAPPCNHPSLSLPIHSYSHRPGSLLHHGRLRVPRRGHPGHPGPLLLRGLLHR